MMNMVLCIITLVGFGGGGNYNTTLYEWANKASSSKFTSTSLICKVPTGKTYNVSIERKKSIVSSIIVKANSNIESNNGNGEAISDK